MESPEILKNIIRRERKARKAAEQVIEQKSLEIFLANEQLKSLNESLEEKIRKRTEEIETSNKALQVAKTRAEYATKAKSDFLSKMSHELRTPLNAIVGFTDLIIQQNKDEVTSDFANTIKYAAGNLVHIINEILDFSKIEAGKLSFEEIDFNFCELIAGLKEIFSHRADERSIEYLFDIDEGIPQMLKGDKVKLNQIFMNLIGNAFKFTEEGFIKVSAKIIEKAEGDFHLFASVQDTGIGIPKSEQQEIFSTFAQASSNTTRLYGGTGLGLTITKQFIELQGGKVWLESKEDKGSIFYFELPIKLGLEFEPQKQEELILKEGFLQDLSILVVEDVAVNRILMKQIFKKKKIKVEFAENGKESIKILANKNYDLILMDLHMPIMDGKQATQIIRDIGSPVLNHDIPIIALTADAFAETRDEVMELGMDGFLTKPIEIEELYRTLWDLFVDIPE